MRPFLPLSLAVVLLTGCGNLQNLATKARAKKQQNAMEKLAATSSEEAAARLGAKAVGEVAYVDDAEQFVLIRALTGIQLAPEATLETRRDGKRTALLRATPEKKNAFLAADLLEGTPQTGDGVFPSTAKPRPLKPRPAPASSPVIPGSTPAGPTTVNTHDSPPPTLVPADNLDPTNLPALKEAIKTPEDLKR